ncbi:MAG: MFS transporter, partial [Erythrobacter sp.]|nr:MFS transporter [Erythrobacter sp.]
MATAAASGTGVQPVRLTLWILLTVYIFNFIDRQIVNILAEPIAKDLDLSDTQIGLMTGLAFALFYTVLGIPIARFADRQTTSRPRLIAVSVAFWSVMTALCGLAQNFWQLLLARVGVGVGEAGCTPPAHSLISDMVPPEKRASALAFYSLG